MKHTPGKLELIKGTEHHGPYVVSDYGDVADFYVIHTDDYGDGPTTVINHQGDKAEANATRVVKTWNAHDDLVRELTNFVNGVATGDISTFTDETLANVVRRSRDILNKLKESGL